MYVEDDVENPSQDTEDINEVLLTVSCMDFLKSGSNELYIG